MVHVQRYRQICNIYYMMKLPSSLPRYDCHYAGITHVDWSVSKILRRLWNYSQHSPFCFNFRQIEMYVDDDFKRFDFQKREYLFSWRKILQNYRTSWKHARLHFWTGGGEGKKNRTRGTGTRGAICSSFALITATKCLAREALVVSSATRRRPWAIST